MLKKLTLGLMIGVLCIISIPGCSDDDGTKPPDTVDQFDVVRTALDAYLTKANMAPTIAAQSVFDNLQDGNEVNNPYILSVRNATDDEVGHVPGAKTIFWRSIADPTKIATLPTDKQIVVYCYTGHTGAVATTCLNAMGYNAVNMKFGIGSWTRDTAVRKVPAYNDATDAHDYPVDTTPHTLTATYDFPALDVTTSTDSDEVVRAAAAAYTSNTSIPPTITAQEVFDNLNDNEAGNDYMILSVRSAADYAKGHVPGAYNIPYKEIAKVDNLKKLPPNKKIVVYCYTGHTGGVATTCLRMLGYDAVNMKFGIMAWTRDAVVRTALPFSEETDAHDFPFETGPTQ